MRRKNSPRTVMRKIEYLKEYCRKNKNDLNKKRD